MLPTLAQEEEGHYQVAKTKKFMAVSYTHSHQNGAARTDCVEGIPSLRLRGIHRTYGRVRGAAAHAARQRQPASDRLRFDARWYAHAAAAATAGGPLAAKQSCHGARTAARMEERGKGLYARCFLHAMSAAHRIHTHF